jgi:hypothetical protein
VPLMPMNTPLSSAEPKTTGGEHKYEHESDTQDSAHHSPPKNTTPTAPAVYDNEHDTDGHEPYHAPSDKPKTQAEEQDHERKTTPIPKIPPSHDDTNAHNAPSDKPKTQPEGHDSEVHDGPTKAKPSAPVAHEGDHQETDPHADPQNVPSTMSPPPASNDKPHADPTEGTHLPSIDHKEQATPHMPMDNGTAESHDHQPDKSFPAPHSEQTIPLMPMDNGTAESHDHQPDKSIPAKSKIEPATSIGTQSPSKQIAKPPSAEPASEPKKKKKKKKKKKAKPIVDSQPSPAAKSDGEAVPNNQVITHSADFFPLY